MRFQTVVAVRLLCLAIILPAMVFGLTPSSVSLIASPNPSNYGQVVTLTASVTSGATGKVTFYDGTTVLGIGAISGTQATLTTVMLPSGNRALRAYYAGDATYAASTSASLPLTVAAGTSLGFRHAVNVPTSWTVSSIAVSDFNGDGKQDLAMTNGSSNVTVFLGSGDGTFQPGVNYSVGSYPYSVAVGDFNGDGRVDLAVANYYGNTVSVLLGNGDGTFQAAVNWYSAGYPCGVAVGDFNGDGNADMVVADCSGGQVNVLLGDGSGTFSDGGTYAVGSSLNSVAVGDFNRDGKTDVVVGTYYGVSVLLGNGNGTLAAAVAYSAGSSDYAVAVGDFNGDGKPDLVVTNYYSGVYVFLGNGDGTFGTAVNYPTGSNNNNYYSNNQVVVADFDGDGKADLGTTITYSNFAAVLPGNGDGTFRAAVPYSAGQYPSAVAAGDFNGDGKADLILASNSYSGFSVLLGGASPDLAITASQSSGLTQGQVGATYTITVTNSGDVSSSGGVGVVVALPSGLTATNLAGNGWTCDLANLVCARSDSLAVAASDTITLKVNVAGGLTGSVTTSFTVSGGGDQNYGNNYAASTSIVRTSATTTLSSSPNPSVLGHAVTLTATVTTGATGTVTFVDGTTVLGTATLAGGQATITTYFLPSGARSLRAQYAGDANYGSGVSAIRTQTVNAVAANGLLPSSSYRVATGLNWVGVGDFNGDGKPDLVTASYNNGSTINVLLGNGDGTFQSAVSYTFGGSYINGAVVGDFNSDGKADIALATNGGLYVLPGNGDGTFQTVLSSNTSNYYTSLATADFNADGKLDLVTLGNGALVVFLGNGDGTFQAPVTVSGGASFSSVAVADMNVDGKADLVGFSTAYNGGATVLLSNGDGTFQSPLTGPVTPTYPMGFTIGDFNGDGKPDVASVYWSGVAVQLGNGDGTLQASVLSSVNFASGYYAIAGDFNGDGKLDIASVGYYSSYVYIAFGNGDGTFGYSASFATDSAPGNVVQADFNGDGKPDFAVSNLSTSTVNVFLSSQFSGLNISATHAGSFKSGQTGAYQITVQNPAFAATSGTVTVRDTLPAGVSATAISGGGWTCTLNTLTCTRSDGLASSFSYPTITIAVNVSGGLSPSTITNQASVTAGGITNTATDPTVIVLATTTTLVVSPNPSTLGQTVSMTATVTTGATGPVLFSDGGTPLGAAALSGGQATFSTRLIDAGRHSLLASYGGDSTHAPSTSSANVQTVNASPASGLATAATYTTGTGPWAIASGDFNRDGKTDLATANSTANTVSVLLGNGNGTFAANVDYAVGTKPVAVVTGDFNNDGKTDLAVANQTSNNVSILIGNGDGTFQAAVNYSTGGGPVSLAVGDLNGDGWADLVVVNASDGSITVLSGNGDGTFHPAASPITAYSVGALAIGDFNHDGKADIAYLYSNFYVYVLPGNGDGTFQSVLGSYVSSAYALAVGDLNADGKPDIVVSDGSGVSVLVGSGDGTFQSYVHYNTGSQAASVLFADVNGDGKLDVVAINSGANTVSVLMGNGDGTLQPAITYGAGSAPRGAVAGDFNGDGRTGIAVANSSGNNVSVLLGVLTSVLSITSSHASYFSPGQNGALYTITVTNNGPGTPSGAVTVTDTLPAGLSATAMAGTGWSCVLATLTCTRSDTLAVGASYPAITVTFNVTLSTPAIVTNQVGVSGGGATSGSATDPTSIGLPVLSIAKTHTGNFMQGQLTAIYTVTVSNSALAAPTSGTVTVAETVPAGLTLVSMAGNGWTCPGTAANNCTRGDVLNGGSSYPAITVTVNVAAAASSPQVNQVTVTGGASAAASATDSTAINAQTLSVSPSSGSGSAGTFQFVASDSAGYADLSAVEVVIAGSFSGVGSCYLRYERAANRLFLVNDGGTQFIGPAAVGVAGTLSNSQCSLNAGATTAAGSGNSLTLTVPITFANGFAGNKNVYLWASTAGGQNSGYAQRGTWTVLGTVGVASTVSVTPSSGSGSSGNFQFVASDTAGFADLSALEVVIAGSFSSAGACYLRYEPASARLYLVNDAGTQFAGPATVGVAGTLSNSQCSLNAGSTTVTSSGTTLTVTVPIAFANGFAGSKNVYLWASTAAGQNSGYAQRGTWTVPLTVGVPSTISVTPASGSGSTGTFQFVASDTAGYLDLSALEVVIGGNLSGPAACYLRYERAANRLYLVNDGGTQFTGPATVGVAGNLSNSQCSLNAGATTVSGSGNNLTLTVPITFTNGFAGNKNHYLWASTVAGANSGYTTRGTWTVPVTLGIPSTISVTPSSGSGNSGTFQFVASDSAGYADLAAIEVVIADHFTGGGGTCYLRYEQAANRLYLLDDGGWPFIGPATVGVAGTLSNSQCSLNAGAATVAFNGNTLTLTVPITFTNAFAGSKNVYLWANTVVWQSSGYTQRGTWTVPQALGIPSTVSVTPSSGSGSSGTFQFVASDTAGYADLSALEVVIAGSFTGAGACYLRYEQAANRLYLVGDDAWPFIGPATVGVAGTLSNSQCSLNAGAATVAFNGNTLTLTVPITFTNAFAGSKNVYLWANTVAWQSSGYSQRGTWTVSGTGGGVPSTVSVTPSSGSGSSGTFQFVASDMAGYADLSAIEAVMAFGFSGSGACYLRYERATNLLYLVNDAGTQFTGPATVGVAGTLSNSQCILNAAAATAIGNGNTLTLTVPISFPNSFAGSKNVYLWAGTVAGANSGYTQRGTWTVTATVGVPSTVSVTPSSGSGSSWPFQFVASDTAGYADLSAIEAVIAGSFSGAGACYLRYERATNRLYLVNDAGNQLTGPATVGVPGTLSNSQCSLNAGATTITGTGNTLAVTVTITFTSGFAGSKNVYLWANTVAGATSGYTQRGTWTVP